MSADAAFYIKQKCLLNDSTSVVVSIIIEISVAICYNQNESRLIKTYDYFRFDVVDKGGKYFEC